MNRFKFVKYSMFAVIGWVAGMAGMTATDWHLYVILIAAGIASNIDIFKSV